MSKFSLSPFSPWRDGYAKENSYGDEGFSVRSVLLALAGCAGVSVQRVASEADYQGGVRFYQPQPYLLVTDAKGAIETSVVYLPKTNEEYAYRVRSGLNGRRKATLDQARPDLDRRLADERRGRDPDGCRRAWPGGRRVQGRSRAAGRARAGLYAIEFDPKTGLASGLRRVELKVESSK